ncbi:threonine/serine ThrE exporter family protein [Granulosicoccus antarcticus]|uniref:Threonine/serine exporter-like N-terminal domain-containing protein n=1 Tax=Granulosicoccus antarcticus IMCC3135 TaxID=1192854 RepID=A0A2Z2NYI4_9GAMM|nr:threonine/serine exporter family protein [Granulosicoccus antarcticus]ASJ74818.1 hypothetical protein IMCC3135_23745 [Granulosicoccus antarcticus IMCC3135]
MALTFKQQCAFVIKLGEMLHKYGTPAFRLEAHLKTVAGYLELDGYFLVSPTTLTYCLWIKGAPDDDVYNYSMRVRPGDLDLGSLARTDALVNDLVAGNCTLEEAKTGLKTIETSGPPYPELVTLLAYIVLGSAFSMMMRGSWNDVMWAGGLSMLVYSFVVWSGKSQRISTMLEPLAATVVAVIAVAVSRFDPGVNQPLVVLSSIIVFVPGLSLAMGFRELAERELISGTARIMDSLMVLFKLYFGTVLGVAIGVLIWGDTFPVDEYHVPHWTVWPAVLLLASSLSVVFKARLVDAPWGIASGLLAYGVSTLVTDAWGTTLGAFLGAFVVGAYANLFARWRNAPAALVTLPGIVVLVPGSKVYVGLDDAISSNALGIDNIGVQSFLLFMSLIAGLVFASAVVEPRKSL